MAKRAVARRPLQRRGRAAIALALVAFLLVTTGVVWRRSVGVAKARELHVLDRQQAELQAERAKLVTDVRSGSSLGRLGAVVSQRLGMRIPSDSQLIRLPRPTRARGS